MMHDGLNGHHRGPVLSGYTQIPVGTGHVIYIFTFEQFGTCAVSHSRIHDVVVVTVKDPCQPPIRCRFLHQLAEIDDVVNHDFRVELIGIERLPRFCRFQPPVFGCTIHIHHRGRFERNEAVTPRALQFGYLSGIFIFEPRPKSCDQNRVPVIPLG